MSLMIRIHKNLSTKFLNLVNNSKIAKPETTASNLKYSSLFSQKSCQLCDEKTLDKPFFCNDCYWDLPRNETRCGICCLALTMAHSEAAEPSLICGECLTLPPSFTMTLCPFSYEFPVKQVIKRIKYSKQRYWVNALCWALSQEYLLALKNHAITKPDLLIPIPIHKSKRKERGYNQAELIAKTLSKSTNIAISKNTLLKIKSTDTQARLSKQERMKNLRDSFGISKKASKQGTLAGKHIALIDDVMTTKVTCELAGKLLLEHGAKRVDVWCLARTPKIR